MTALTPDEVDTAVARAVADWHAARRHADTARRARGRARAVAIAYDYGTITYPEALRHATRARRSARRAATRAQRAGHASTVLWWTDADGRGRPVAGSEHAAHAAHDADVTANTLAALRALGRRRGDHRE